MTLWDQAIAAKAFELEIADPETTGIILGGSEIDSSSWSQIQNELAELLELIFSVPSRFFGNHLHRMAMALGFTADEAQLFADLNETLSADVLTRADLVRTSGRWKVVEINIGSNVGAMFFSSLPRLIGLKQNYDVMDQWAKHVTSLWDVGDHFAFIIDQKYVDVARKPLGLMATEIKKYAPCRTSILGHLDLHTLEGELVDNLGHKITFVHRHFNELNIVPSRSEYEPILQAITKKRVACPMGVSYSLLSNKAILAFLWELSEADKLTPSESNLVRKLIPETFRFSEKTFTRAVTEQKSLVLKPINDLQGKNVFCGSELSPADWREKLEGFLTERNSQMYVLQEFSPPDSFELTVAGPSALSSEACRIVWGLYTFGTELLGGMLRAKPVGDTAVINLANGGAIGPLPRAL